MYKTALTPCETVLRAEIQVRMCCVQLTNTKHEKQIAAPTQSSYKTIQQQQQRQIYASRHCALASTVKFRSKLQPVFDFFLYFSITGLACQ